MTDEGDDVMELLCNSGSPGEMELNAGGAGVPIGKGLREDMGLTKFEGGSRWPKL